MSRWQDDLEKIKKQLFGETGNNPIDRVNDIKESNLEDKIIKNKENNKENKKENRRDNKKENKNPALSDNASEISYQRQDKPDSINSSVYEKTDLNPFHRDYHSYLELEMEKDTLIEIPPHILKKRQSAFFDNGKSYPILISKKDNLSNIRLHNGDIFNAILMTPGKRGDYRIFQFSDMIGYVKLQDNGRYDLPTFQDMRINFVYRFETLGISRRKSSRFYARPLWPVDWEDSIYIDYTPASKVKLKKR